MAEKKNATADTVVEYKTEDGLTAWGARESKGAREALDKDTPSKATSETSKS